MKSHLSEEQISQWIAGDRSTEAEQHLLDCPECAAQVADTQKSLLLFRDSGYQCAEYWQKQPQMSASRRPARWAVAGAALAVAVITSVVLFRKPEPQAPRNEEVFLQIPYVVPPAPYERTTVVHMDVPVAALITAGFRMDASAANSVSADVMVGQDGRPLAVGFPPLASHEVEQ
jgi:hypothetical protein